MLTLDPAGDHWLTEAGTLEHRDARSRLVEPLRTHLVIEAESVWLGPTRLATRSADRWAPDVRLTALELRYLADRGVPHPVPEQVAREAPRTDLHTHFAGCVRGADLVRIGAETGVVIPRTLLRRAGITAPADLALAEATDEVRGALARAMQLPVDRPCTHKDMDRVYALRRPITKHRPAFPTLCAQIARDYSEMGIRYAELSLFDILDPEILAAAHATLPDLKRTTGVDLRFLAALSRHDDLEWDLDMVRRLEAFAGSALIVGVDFMGHETSSTHTFVPQIRAVADFARTHRPDFVIRVHAGENPMFPENVRVAVETLAEAGVHGRIGHGLYGVDDATLARIVECGTVVEFNLESNIALNNVADALQAPLARYADAGAAVVLGTDGYGIYHADGRSQARAAALSGLSDLTGVLQVEAAVLAAREAADGRLAMDFPVPPAPAPVHFTDEVAARIAAERAADRARLGERIAALGIPLIEPEALRAGSWVSIAGSWKHAWSKMSGAEQDRIRHVLDGFVAGLAERGASVITGGTRHGVEGCVHEAARRHGVFVVGAVVDASPPEDLDAVDQFCRVGRTLYDKAAGLYGLLASHRGFAAFFGGGNIVHDEARVATNARLRRGFLAGVSGASGRAAERWPAFAFRDAAGALARFDDTAPSGAQPYWFVGVNPSADILAVRPGPEILLVRRRAEADTESGRWALPGTFVRSTAARDMPFVAGVESARAAALRALASETGLDVRWMEDRLVRVGAFEGSGRDPRDSDVRWSRSEAFVLTLSPNLAAATLTPGSDAASTGWFALDDLPVLAFDHARIVDAARPILRR